MNHMIVKVGMKSIPGISSSTKENIPPKKPLLKPNMRQKITAEIGAQMISPINGINVTALPIKSINRHLAREGSGLCCTG